MDKFNFNQRLSATDIIEIGKNIGLKVRVYARNAIPKKLTNGYYVINLDSKNGSGTHWVCFVKDNKNIFYMDSFGMPPAQDEINVFKKEHDDVYFNNKQIQDINSILCGYFCLLFLNLYHHYGKNEPEILNVFYKLFSKNTKFNDNKLKNYMNNII